jgi:integrase
MRHRLTDKYLASLKGNGAYRTVWDTQLPAFGIRCGKRRKTFTVMVGKRRRRITLGHYPQLSLHDARDKARRLFLDPPNSSLPFKDVLNQYISLHLQPNTRATTARQAEQVLRKHFKHFYGTPIAQLTRTAILSTIDALIETPAAANQATSCFGAFLQWCLRRGILQVNPIAGYGSPIKLRSRERVLSDEELFTIAKITLFSQEQYHQRVALLLLTGQRLNEIGRMEWSWLRWTSQEHHTFTIPAHIAKNGHEHTLPLTPHVHQIINSIPKTSKFLFPLPSDPEKTAQSWSYYKRRFDQECGFSNFTLHDLRRTLSTKMAAWELAPPHVVEAILNHRTGTRNSIQRVYDRHTYLPQMKIALELYEKKILQHALPTGSATFDSQARATLRTAQHLIVARDYTPASRSIDE